MAATIICNANIQCTLAVVACNGHPQCHDNNCKHVTFKTPQNAHLKESLPKDDVFIEYAILGALDQRNHYLVAKNFNFFFFCKKIKLSSSNNTLTTSAYKPALNADSLHYVYVVDSSVCEATVKPH